MLVPSAQGMEYLVHDNAFVVTPITNGDILSSTHTTDVRVAPIKINHAMSSTTLLQFVAVLLVVVLLLLLFCCCCCCCSVFAGYSATFKMPLIELLL